MFRTTTAVLMIISVSAFAQPRPKPDPMGQLEAKVTKALGGGPNTAYAVLLVTETPDGKLKQSGALLVDLFTLPARAGFWAGGQNSPLPWLSPQVDARSSWAVEVAVFADKKSAVEAVAAFGLGQENGRPRTWQLLKRTDGLAAGVKAANAEQAKLEKQAKVGTKITVTRRTDPAKK